MVARRHRVEQREHRDRQARGDQDAALADAIADRAGDRRRDRGRVGQEAEEQPGLGARPAEREDVKRRGRQQLKRGHEDREAVAAHQEEARREQAIFGPQPVIGSDIEDDLADVLAGLHQAMRLGGLRAAETRRGSTGVTVRCSSSGHTLRPQRRGDGALLRRRARPQRRAGDRQALAHHQREDRPRPCALLRKAICTSRPSIASASRLRAM